MSSRGPTRRDLARGQQVGLGEIVELVECAPMGDGARRALDEHSELTGQIAALLPKVDGIARLLIDTFGSGGRAYAFGNGGSAADAQHFAGELVGRYVRERRPLAASALSVDPSVVTALANDYSFDEVFARQVRAHARPGDVVVGFTTSGRSANVVRGSPPRARSGRRPSSSRAARAGRRPSTQTTRSWFRPRRRRASRRCTCCSRISSSSRSTTGRHARERDRIHDRELRRARDRLGDARLERGRPRDERALPADRDVCGAARRAARDDPGARLRHRRRVGRAPEPGLGDGRARRDRARDARAARAFVSRRTQHGSARRTSSARARSRRHSAPT